MPKSRDPIVCVKFHSTWNQDHSRQDYVTVFMARAQHVKKTGEVISYRRALPSGELLPATERKWNSISRILTLDSVSKESRESLWRHFFAKEWACLEACKAEFEAFLKPNPNVPAYSPAQSDSRPIGQRSA